MEVTYTTKAIILTRQPFREFDSKVAVYSLDKGKLELVARGAKKILSKLAGHLEPVSLSNIMVVRGKQYDYIGGAMNKNCFAGIKNDLDKVLAAQKAIFILHKIIKENEPDRQVFDLLFDFLYLLDEQSRLVPDYDLFYYFFVLKLLVVLGHGPELYNCAVCRKKIGPSGNKFNLGRGGVVCQKCRAPDKRFGQMGLTISENCIKILRIVATEDWGKIVRTNTDNKLKKEVIKIIGSFYNYYF